MPLAPLSAQPLRVWAGPGGSRCRPPPCPVSLLASFLAGPEPSLAAPGVPRPTRSSSRSMALSPRLRPLALGLFIILIQSRGAAQQEGAEDHPQKENVGGPYSSDEEEDDLDLCLEKKLECGFHANCKNNSCICVDGFEKVPEKGDDCEDIDECQKNTSICGPYGSCINTKGDYLCKCKPGFAKSIQDDKKICRDIDECKQNICHESAKCENVEGSFLCTCPSGYFQYMDVGPLGKNITKCKEFSCPEPSSDNCSDEQALLCDFKAKRKHLCDSLLEMRGATDAKKQLQSLLALLDDLVALMPSGNKEQGHRFVTEMMETVEVLLRVLAFALPKNTVSTGSSNGTELTMDIRTAGNRSQSPAWLLQDSIQMELNWEAASKEGEALGLAGLLSYHRLGPILADAHVEGKEWERVGKSPQCAQVPGKPNYEVLSTVASAFVGHNETTALRAPVFFNFSHRTAESRPDLQVICAFWKPVNGSGHWSQEGCTRLDTSTDTSTHCRCDHLTSFAVLMAFYDVEDWGLDIITKIGLVVSLICLFLSILTFLFCRAIRGIRTTIHLHLCLALFVGYVIFLMGAGNTGNQTTCAVVAGLLHFFFLSVFCWMLLEGMELYLMVVKVFNTHSLRHWHIFLVGYGIPAIVVGISAAVNSEGYGNLRNCWLKMDKGFLWSFLAPVALIIMLNAVVFVVTVWKLSQKFADINPDMSKLKKQRVLTITAIAQLCILGTTWVFGLFQFSNQTLVMSYIFTILNSLQGLFIFLLHCLLKKQVRDDYYRWFCKDKHGKPHSSDKYSNFSSTVGSNTLQAPSTLKESGI
ncbi:adhesion G protein-coupled receptor E5 isoform X2 [Podarcis muralis]